MAISVLLNHDLSVQLQNLYGELLQCKDECFDHFERIKIDNKIKAIEVLLDLNPSLRIIG